MHSKAEGATIRRTGGRLSRTLPFALAVLLVVTIWAAPASAQDAAPVFTNDHVTIIIQQDGQPVEAGVATTQPGSQNDKDEPPAAAKKEGFLTGIGKGIIKHLPKAIGLVAMLAATWVISGWIGRLTTRSLGKAKIEKTLAGFLGNVARWALLVLGVIASVSTVGVEATSFVAVLGTAGLAIGLALQGSLSNLAAGVMLLIFRPFKVGDAVVVGGQLGKVAEIELFNTMVDTFDNRRIVLPNKNVFGETIENLTFHDTRRVDIAVGVEYSADMDKTREVLTEAAANVPGRLDNPAPQIILLKLGDSSVDWQVRVWANTDDYWVVWDAATKVVKASLDKAGLGIPFPQMDVHLDPPAS